MKGIKSHDHFSTNGNGKGPLLDARNIFDEEEIQTCSRKLKGKTDGQCDYIDTIDRSIITICDGVAGTGKTYIAVAKAVKMLEDGVVNRIIFSRPAVECGKGLGYLPGEDKDKFLPYTSPFYDGLRDFLPKKKIEEYLLNDIIEFAPLEYMRGETFKKSVMVLDEAQNVSKAQMKMFMTRIGNDSRMIIVGDSRQSDLPSWEEYFSFIVDVFDKKPYVDGISVVYLGEKDIVRHGIIREIIKKIGE